MRQATTGRKPDKIKALLLTIGLLGSTQCAFASDGLDSTGAAPGKIQAPLLLGGVALAKKDVSRPKTILRTDLGFRAYDAEAIGSVRDDATSGEVSPGIDPIKTAAIIPGVFGSFAIPMRNFPVSARWAPIYRAISQCSDGNACENKSSGFANILKAAQGKGFHEKLSGINRGINGLITYRQDKAVYGSIDHWAQPKEILLQRAGDCEDFAILKMTALLKLGIPAQSMSLVVLQDRAKGVFHAVLSVSTGSGTFILDNVRNTVVKDSALPSYVPLYSFSIDRAWIHGAKSGSPQVADMKGGFAGVVPGEGPGGPTGEISSSLATRLSGLRLRAAD